MPHTNEYVPSKLTYCRGLKACGVANTEATVIATAVGILVYNGIHGKIY